MSPEPSSPWLSVILPVHRGERWIERTLESLAIQADKGVEVVVIDTSPGQGTMALIQRFSERLTLRILDPAGTDGCSPKVNLGVAEASAPRKARS